MAHASSPAVRLGLAAFLAALCLTHPAGAVTDDAVELSALFHPLFADK